MNTRSGAAFSLVEVVIALGVISFALVSMLGLLGVGINASRQSSESTAMTAMISQVLGKVRAASNAPPATNFFFDADGLPLTNSVGAIYECRASATLPPSGEISDVSDKFMKAALVFTWPVSAAVPPHTNTVHASLLLP
jgi:uncharacterized protein (TIGR02598 family)